jgi:hypothetical protein
MSAECQVHADLSLRCKVTNALVNTNPNNLFAPNFRGLIPPDPTLAVGKDRIIIMVNSMVTIYEKSTKETLYSAFGGDFFGVSPVRPGDVWAIYDQLSKRFFLLGFRPAADALTTALFIAVSKNSSPNNNNDFYQYTYTAKDFADYPKLAVDRDGVYISWNTFFADNDDCIQKFVVFRKSNFLTGLPLDLLTEQTITDQVVKNNSVQLLFPVQPQLDLGYNKCGKIELKSDKYKVYLVSAFLSDDFNGNTIRVYSVDNLLTAPILKYQDVKVAPYITDYSGMRQKPPVNPPAGQPIINYEINNLIFHTGVIRGKYIWTAHIVLDATGKRNIIRWYQLKVSHIISVSQEGNVDSGNTDEMAYPAITVDIDGNMGLAFSLGGVDRNLSIGYTGRLKSDPKNTVRLPIQVAVEGSIYYQVTFGSTRNRGGDYSGIALDPVDQKSIYFFNEYPIPVNPAGNPNQPPGSFAFGSNWSTFLGSFQINRTSKSTCNAPQRHNLISSVSYQQLLQINNTASHVNFKSADDA